MKHLDITLDFETAALSANAAVLQLGAVAWNRHADKNPFLITDKIDTPINQEEYIPVSSDGNLFEKSDLGQVVLAKDAVPSYIPETFCQSFDLRDQVFAGREFNAETVAFWAEKQKDDVKQGILSLEPVATRDVLYNFTEWVKDLVRTTGADSVCLWAQGTDFDIAILRSLAVQFNIEMPRNIYKNFRDARTYIMEMGAAYFLEDTDEAHRNPNTVYKTLGTELPQFPIQGNAHDALYDSLRSTWNVWSLMKAVEATQR